jgi:hypothetical protein
LRLDKVDFFLVSNQSPPVSASFIGRSGTDFVLDGAAFRLVGANVYNAAGDPTIYECGPWMHNPDTELDEWFERLKRDSSARVIRFWAYQKYTNGGTDWRGLDRVMRLANKHDLKVIPVLENQWADCTEGGYKYDSWYAGGYLDPYGTYPISYKEYVKRVVERYKNEPAVAAWMLMNEAESKSATDGSAKPGALYTFASDMSQYVKSLDKNHLVTLGTIGSGQPGTAGADWERLHALDTIDFTEYHDYARNDEPMPGAPLEPSVPLNTAVFTQDADWNWTNGDYRQNKARVWETFTYEIPPGREPFKRLGLNFHGTFKGDIYLDEVQVGSKVYGFEHGTTEGWGSSAPVTLANSCNVVYSGIRSLKLTLSEAKDAKVWVDLSAEDVAGTVRVNLRSRGRGRTADPDKCRRASLGCGSCLQSGQAPAARPYPRSAGGSIRCVLSVRWCSRWGR